MGLSKNQALSILFKAVDAYKTNLVNHSLLFLCSGKDKNIYDFTVTFDESNFLHLTGVKTKLHAKQFFELCVNRRLKATDFEMAKDGTTDLKLEVLPALMKSNLSAKMVGDYDSSKPLLIADVFAGSVKACIGFSKTGKTNRYVPSTVLKEDIRKIVFHPDRILFTFRKDRKELNYSELVYAAKNIEIEKLVFPEEYRYLYELMKLQL